MKRFTWSTGMGLAGALTIPALAVAALELPNTFKAGDPVSAAAMNANFNALKAKADELEAQLATHGKPAAWTAPAYLNSWVDYGGSYAAGGYRKDEHGVVHLGGVIKDGDVGKHMFVLPAGHRPTSSREFLVVNNSTGFAHLIVWNTGQVFTSDGTAGFVSLEGVSFIAEL